jgi:hypothetical protein
MKKGLTSWCFRVGWLKIMFRWNMRHLGWKTKRFGDHGYAERGPLILEW